MSNSRVTANHILQDTVILIEDSGSLYANEHADALGKKLGLEVHTIPKTDKKKRFVQANWQLVFTQNGLALRVADEPSWSDILVDFASANLQYRKAHGGGRNEALAKAIGIKGKDKASVLDCTAGMGTDSFIMASVGAQVTMIERNPIIAALLEDAIWRAQNSRLDICNDMALIQQDAISYLSENTVRKSTIDVIYLDPMFPHKKKSALVKKEMRAFQRMLGPDADSSKLMNVAISAKPKRIVVKRPSVAPELENEAKLSPSMTIGSKKHRFDVYLLR